MAPHSSTLAWKIPWREEPGRLWSMTSLTVGYDWASSLSCIGEGNVNPLRCSCLGDPRDRKAWWAAVYGVAQSQTGLKWLSSSSGSRIHFTNILLNICIYVYQWCWPVIFFVVSWFSFGRKMRLALQKEFRSIPCSANFGIIWEG